MKELSMKRFAIIARNTFPIILGIIALLLSWQAYRVAQETNEIVAKQNQPNIVLADAIPGGLYPYPYKASDGNYVLCVQYIRFQNVGGNPTSLTGFDLVIADGYGKSIQLTNQYGEARIIANPDLLPGISSFYAYLFPDNLKITDQTFGIPNELELPVQIAPYSAIDVQTGLRFIIGSSLWQSINDTNSNENLLIQLIYTFHFASRQNLSTQEMTCYWHE